MEPIKSPQMATVRIFWKNIDAKKNETPEHAIERIKAELEKEFRSNEVIVKHRGDIAEVQLHPNDPSKTKDRSFLTLKIKIKKTLLVRFHSNAVNYLFYLFFMAGKI